MLDDSSIIRNKKRRILFRVVLRIRRYFSAFYRQKINEGIRNKVKGIDFSLLCNNCVAGVFYQDAGRRYTTPTVGLAFDGEDFVKFLENPQKYRNKNFEFFERKGYDYPMAKIEDIEVRFVHYKTEKECIEKWNSRFERINWANLFVVATDVDGLYQQKWLERFDKLPYKNKIMFVAKSHPEYEWAIPVSQFKNKPCVNVLTDFANMRGGQRYYETAFDIAEWIKECSQSSV